MRPNIADSHTFRDLISRYRVSFSIRSSDVVLCGRAAQVAFHLELRGQHDGQCGGAFCLGCNHVLRVLFEVADTLRHFERKAVKQAAYAYKNNALCGSGHARDREVVLALQMTVRRHFGRARRGWGWEFVEGLTSVLTGLGCRDGSTEEVSESRACLGPARKEPGPLAVNDVSLATV